VAPPPEIGSADPKSDSPQAEVAPQAGVAKQAELAKKEADGKRGQPLDSKAKSYDQLAAKQAAELDATGAAVAPLARAATPYAPTDKDEFRASSSQMANVGSLTSARQVATWQMTEAGNLQRSFDGGKSWESVSVGQPVRLRVVAAIGFHIWAGGNGGLLFHSRDGGNSFSVVRVGREHSTLGGDIVTLAFPDAQHGRLETSAHEVWTSSDGGQSWVGSFPAK
jgi:photosystem II stability/assembly factor-like uncharacterized protein